MKLRLGIIGGGFAKNVVIPAAMLVPEIQVAGICTRTPESAQQIADQFALPFFTVDWRQMLSQGFDLFYVGVPPLVQEDILEELIARKIPFLCEKPLGVSLDRLERLVDKAGPDYPCLINFEFSQIPTWIEAQRLINTGAIGELERLDVEWKTMQGANKQRLETWKTKVKEGGAAINVYGSHALFSMLLFGGGIEKLDFKFSKQPNDSRDTHTSVRGAVKFETGAEGSLLLDCESDELYHQITAKGSSGAIVLRQEGPNLLAEFKLKMIKGENEFDMNQDFVLNPGEDGRLAGLIQMLNLLLLKITDYRIPGPTLHDGLAVQRLISLALR